MVLLQLLYRRHDTLQMSHWMTMACVPQAAVRYGGGEVSTIGINVGVAWQASTLSAAPNWLPALAAAAAFA